jgi:SPP1 family phage portal protein
MKTDVKNIIRLIEYPRVSAESLIDGVLPQEFILNIINSSDNFLSKFNDNDNFYISKNQPLNGYSDIEAPQNEVNIPHAKTMTNTVKGYMFKPGLIKYAVQSNDDQTEGSDNETTFDRLMHVFRVNHEDIKNAKLGESQSKYGVAFELLYTKLDVKTNKVEPYFTLIDPKEVIPIFDDTIEKNLICAIRIYAVIDWSKNDKENTLKKVEVYYVNKVDYFTLKVDNEQSKLEFVESKPHYFKDIPLVIYYNNDEILADYEPVRSMVVLYDKLFSDAANELDRFAAAYLVMKNYVLAGNTEEARNVLERIKSLRVFEVGADGDVRFLTKDIPVEFLREIKDSLKKDIVTHSHIPDFHDETFGTASGIALQYKLMDFENLCADKEAYFKQGLERRISLITNYLSLLNVVDEDNEITISFSRNIPNNNADSVKMAAELKGSGLPVSDETILTQIPFIEDAKKEIEKYNTQEEERKEKESQEFDIENINENTLGMIDNSIENMNNGIVSDSINKEIEKQNVGKEQQ